MNDPGLIPRRVCRFRWTPAKNVSKQDRCVNVDLFVIVLYLQAEAASLSVRVLFVDPT